MQSPNRRLPKTSRKRSGQQTANAIQADLDQLTLDVAVAPDAIRARITTMPIITVPIDATQIDMAKIVTAMAGLVVTMQIAAMQIMTMDIRGQPITVDLTTMPIVATKVAMEGILNDMMVAVMRGIAIIMRDILPTSITRTVVAETVIIAAIGATMIVVVKATDIMPAGGTAATVTTSSHIMTVTAMDTMQGAGTEITAVDTSNIVVNGIGTDAVMANDTSDTTRVVGITDTTAAGVMQTGATRVAESTTLAIGVLAIGVVGDTANSATIKAVGTQDLLITVLIIGDQNTMRWIRITHGSQSRSLNMAITVQAGMTNTIPTSQGRHQPTSCWSGLTRIKMGS